VIIVMKQKEVIAMDNTVARPSVAVRNTRRRLISTVAAVMILLAPS